MQRYGSSARGDILVSDGTGLRTLVVGADETVLVADSAQALGVKWDSVLGIIQGGDATRDLRPSKEGVVTGGVRGEGSVDFQMARTATTEVASGAGAVLLATTGSTAAATRSACIATADCTVSAAGTGSLVAGSSLGTVSGASSSCLGTVSSTVTGAACHCLGCDTCTVAGTNNMCMASTDSDIESSQSESAIVGCDNCAITNTAGAGLNNVIEASDSCTITGGSSSMIVASVGSTLSSCDQCTLLAAPAATTMTGCANTLAVGSGHTLTDLTTCVVLGEGVTMAGAQSRVFVSQPNAGVTETITGDNFVHFFIDSGASGVGAVLDTRDSGATQQGMHILNNAAGFGFLGPVGAISTTTPTADVFKAGFVTTTTDFTFPAASTWANTHFKQNNDGMMWHCYIRKTTAGTATMTAGTGITIVGSPTLAASATDWTTLLIHMTSISAAVTVYVVG